MFFTQEDYNKIYEYIRRRGIKDTEFGVSSPLDGTELISLVQKGNNVKTTLSNFLASFRTSNFINVTEIGSNPSGKYTLEEAIREIKKPARVGGCLITFIDKETNDWKVFQFLGKDKDDWYDLEYWRDILGITEKKFKGAFISEEALYNTVKAPEVGDYAFVGTSIGESVVYVCKTRFVWSSTTEKATEYLTVLIQGTVTVGPNGNWFNNGEDTGIPAKGEKGDKPYFRFNATTGNVEYSFNQTDWEVLVNKEEITGAAATVTVGTVTTLDENSNAQVTNSGTTNAAILNFKIPKGKTGDGLIIKGTYDTEEILKEKITSPKIGDNYAVGTVAPYHLWCYTNVYNSETDSTTPQWKDLGELTKDTTIITQSLGDKEDVVPSQALLNKQVKNIGLDEYEEFSEAKAYSIGDTVRKDGFFYTFIVNHEIGAWDKNQVINFSVKNNTAINPLNKFLASNIKFGIINYSDINTKYIQNYELKDNIVYLKVEEASKGNYIEITVPENSVYVYLNITSKISNYTTLDNSAIQFLQLNTNHNSVSQNATTYLKSNKINENTFKLESDTKYIRIYLYNNQYTTALNEACINIIAFSINQDIIDNNVIDINSIITPNQKTDLYEIIEYYYNIGKREFLLGDGTYFCKKNIFSLNPTDEITIKGVGKNNTIIKYVDENFEDGISLELYTDIRFKFQDLTLTNMACYGKLYLTLQNCIFKYTNEINGTQKRMIGNYSFLEEQYIYIDNCEFISDVPQYRGLAFSSYIKHVHITNSKISNCDSYPLIFNGGVENAIIKNNTIDGGVTGILFLRSSNGTTKNCLIDNNTILNISEEGISADIQGNSYNNSKILEISPFDTQEEFIDNYKKRIKIYFNAKRLTNINGNTEEVTDITTYDFINRCVIQFDNTNGGNQCGEFYFIESFGKDDIGNYITIITSNESIEIDLTGSNFDVASIVTGFYSNVISNNKIINNKGMSICLWHCCGGNIIYGNKEIDSYQGINIEKGYASGTVFYSNKNVISNNIVNKIYCQISSYGNFVYGMNNIIVNNICNELDIRYEKNIVLNNNIYKKINKQNVEIFID